MEQPNQDVMGNCVLLDGVMSRNQQHIGMLEGCLMLKVLCNWITMYTFSRISVQWWCFSLRYDLNLSPYPIMWWLVYNVNRKPKDAREKVHLHILLTEGLRIGSGGRLRSIFVEQKFSLLRFVEFVIFLFKAVFCLIESIELIWQTSGKFILMHETSCHRSKDNHRRLSDLTGKASDLVIIGPGFNAYKSFDFWKISFD